MNAVNETVGGLFDLVRYNPEMEQHTLSQLVEVDSRYLKDLKVTLSTALKSEVLSEKETALLALAVAVNNNSKALVEGLIVLAREKEANAAEVAEAIACASLLSANNVLYRFRHFMDNEKYERMPAKIRMNIMMKPVLGKAFFELISLAVSAVNGCERCCRSHEQSVRELGDSEERIWDAIRLASAVTAAGKVL